MFNVSIKIEIDPAAIFGAVANAAQEHQREQNIPVRDRLNRTDLHVNYELAKINHQVSTIQANLPRF